MVTLVSGPAVLLEMTAATAPAAAAFSDFCSKVQPPRRISATVPVKSWPAKSVASQPVVASSGTTRIGPVIPAAGVSMLSFILSIRYAVPPTVNEAATSTSTG